LTIRWYGLDYGETVMNPFTLHQSALIREIYRSVGKEDEAEEHVKRWYALRDSVGSRFSVPDLRVREVKQYARGRIYSEVLDGDPEAVRLFEEGEPKRFAPTEGIGKTLLRVRSAGAAVSIVSEASSASAVMAIVLFLRTHRLSAFFDELITPAGRFDAEGSMKGGEFLGKTKRDGTIYDQLAERLMERGIPTKEAMMVGDDPLLDVRKAKEKGFLATQFMGVVDRGASPSADYVIRTWDELPGPD